ncbi:hypothetical protein WICMUC_001674 [Wickerhamomyces mucosus]|uniref:Uncharacterized protein n=1 Tax=Wickerhamomyces mucosus TaxID=1378264 RepID=A0A9P8TGT7_9ASCO|nr:hypothetical protein WICMUC_001674 [Wickerhamomyces mucosus]
MKGKTIYQAPNYDPKLFKHYKPDPSKKPIQLSRDFTYSLMVENCFKFPSADPIFDNIMGKLAAMENIKMVSISTDEGEFFASSNDLVKWEVEFLQQYKPLNNKFVTVQEYEKLLTNYYFEKNFPETNQLINKQTAKDGQYMKNIFESLTSDQTVSNFFKNSDEKYRYFDSRKHDIMEFKASIENIEARIKKERDSSNLLLMSNDNDDKHFDDEDENFYKAPNRKRKLPIRSRSLFKKINKENLESLAKLVQIYHPYIKSLPNSPELDEISHHFNSYSTDIGDEFRFQYDFDNEEQDPINNDINLASIKKILQIIDKEIELNFSRLKGEQFWEWWFKIFDECIGFQMTRELFNDIKFCITILKSYKFFLNFINLEIFKEIFQINILGNYIKLDLNKISNSCIFYPNIDCFYYRKLNYINNHSMIKSKLYDIYNYENYPMNYSIQELWNEWLYGFNNNLPIRNYEINRYILYTRINQYNLIAQFQFKSLEKFKIIKFIVYGWIIYKFSIQNLIDYLDSLIEFNGENSNWLIKSLDEISYYTFGYKINELQISLNEMFFCMEYNLDEHDFV